MVRQFVTLIGLLIVVDMSLKSVFRLGGLRLAAAWDFLNNIVLVLGGGRSSTRVAMSVLVFLVLLCI